MCCFKGNTKTACNCAKGWSLPSATIVALVRQRAANPCQAPPLIQCLRLRLSLPKQSLYILLRHVSLFSHKSHISFNLIFALFAFLFRQVSHPLGALFSTNWRLFFLAFSRSGTTHQTAQGNKTSS